MTAYENFQYDEDNRVSMIAPALPQEVWAFKVFEFMDTLKQEMERFDDPVSLEAVGEPYADGYYDAAEQLNMRFKEIFDVEVK